MRTTASMVSVVGATLFVITASASIARADVIAPPEMACQGSTEGAECRVEGRTGACAMSRCSRLDYEGWDRDASPTPPAVQYDCLVCEAGAPSSGGGGGGGGGCSVGASTSSAPLLTLLVALAIPLARRRRR